MVQQPTQATPSHSSNPRVGGSVAPIAGPAKWFGAGVLVTGSLAALVIVLLARQPRALPTLMATTVEPASAQPAPAPTVPSPPTPAERPGPSAPLSPLITSMLVPHVTTASSPPIATNTNPPPAPTPQPQVVPAPPAAPAPASAAPKPAPQATPKPPTPAPTPTPAVSPAVSGGTINVNTANSAELELLPQIGPALAARIIEYRTTHGSFKSLNDLDKVKGIGPKTLAKLKPLIRFE